MADRARFRRQIAIVFSRNAAHLPDLERLGGPRLVFGRFIAISQVQDGNVFRMKLRVGFEMHYEFPQPTPMIMVLGTHFTRASDIIVPDHLTTSPSVPISPYRDGFGNWCSRIVAPAGRCAWPPTAWCATAVSPIRCLPPPRNTLIEDLPADALVYLLGSRYCETDRLSEIAWKLFEATPPGWARVQAICDFVHQPYRFRLRARARHHDGVGSFQ